MGGYRFAGRDGVELAWREIGVAACAASTDTVGPAMAGIAAAVAVTRCPSFRMIIARITRLSGIALSLASREH